MQRGFTLIELLVVIAIIGILSSVALAALSESRERSRDAAVKSQFVEIRKQAELFFLNNSSYRGTGSGGNDDSLAECTDTTHSSFAKYVGTMLDPAVTGNMNGLLRAAAANRNTVPGSRVFCRVTATSWAFAMPIYDPPSGMNGWCIDSTGGNKAVMLDFVNSYNLVTC